MTNTYLDAKAAEAALKLSQTHGIDYLAALDMTRSLWGAARSAILRSANNRDWQSLSFAEKSEICRCVVSKLLDTRNLTRLVANNQLKTPFGV